MTLETDIHNLTISRKSMIAMWVLIITIIVFSWIVFSLSTKPVDVIQEVQRARADVRVLQQRVEEISVLMVKRDVEINEIEKELNELKQSIQVDRTQP